MNKVTTATDDWEDRRYEVSRLCAVLGHTRRDHLKQGLTRAGMTFEELQELLQTLKKILEVPNDSWNQPLGLN